MPEAFVGKVIETEVPRFRYRWFGVLEVEHEGEHYSLFMSGTIAQWFRTGEQVKVVLLDEPKRLGGKNILSFDDFELYRIYEGEEIKVWPVFRKEVELPRTDPLTGRVLYKYRILAREAVTESDFKAIVELEQYHYASEKEVVALWRCPRCGRFIGSNIEPRCPRCKVTARLYEIRGSLPASRFLILELLDREPYEPRIVGYVRVDPPIPLMSRRIVKDGEVIIERNIREKVFAEDWFHPSFWPEALLKRLRKRYLQLAKRYGKLRARALLYEEVKKIAISRCNTAAARIARVVVHPDYRGDGLGKLAVKLAVEWIAERRIPEMRKRKHLVETIAQMARYNPFFERAGFRYVWETASGRPVLYYPLTEEARQKLEEFLKTDPYAKEHGGVLYRARYGKVEPLASPIRFKWVTKAYSSTLDISALPENLRQLLKAFGVERRLVQKQVLRNVNLEIKPGEVVVVIGASGAGKTTLLRLLIGACLGIEDERYRPDSGEIEVPKNAKVAALLPGEMEPKFGDESILENIFNKVKDEALAVEILNRAGLADAVFYRARFAELSTGQKERAKLAALLAERPNLIVIDEFAAHLDALLAQRVARRLSQICREAGITLVVATNRMEVVRALSPDKVLLVGYGKVTCLPFEEYLSRIGAS